MHGSVWRFLTAFLLILVATLSRGQGLLGDVPDAPARSSVRPVYLPPVVEPVAPVFPGTPFRPVPPVITGKPPLVRSAGIIFAGHVTSVGHATSPFDKSPPSTAITFQVDHAILGATTGRSLTIHEWAGLWQQGERYRVGEHVFLFLYPPSRLGLTSPVGGRMGRFVIDSRDRIMMNEQNASGFAFDPVISGRTIVPYSDFAQAVQRAQ
jgi:hypothetical protein